MSHVEILTQRSILTLNLSTSVVKTKMSSTCGLRYGFEQIKKADRHHAILHICRNENTDRCQYRIHGA